MLKINIEQEKKLVKELDNLFLHSASSEKEKILLRAAIASKSNQLKILNDSIPLLLKKISFARRLPEEYILKNSEPQISLDNDKEIITLDFPFEGSNKLVAIKRKDKNKYLEELYISESSLKDLKKSKDKTKKESITQYKSPNFYVKTANKFFLNTSCNLIEKGKFNSLKKSLEKGDFVFLLQSYISTMLFTTLISFFLSFFIVFFLFFFEINTSPPFLALVDLADVNVFIRLIEFIWLVIIIPVAVFLIMYIYPSTEKSSLGQKINYELPFVAIQMAAIAGSDIEPSNIFRIISMSKEYPYIRKESKKIMNQVNLYGYDLINALKNVAAASSSENWTDLLNGISTTLRSGGDLSKYLNKKAESLLFEYRLKREKSIKSAETFMDIYISVVIAAPMLMMLLLVMMSISNIGFSLSVQMITIIIVSSVSLINIIFLIFLHLNQKKF